MLNIFQWFRLLKIKLVLLRYCFIPSVLQGQPLWIRGFCYFNPWSYRRNLPTQGQAIRKTLEELGPVFVKFGQMLSTRPDFIKPEIIEELEKLQDRVPPFPGAIAVKLIEQNFHRPIKELFNYFNEQPLASASIAQVHVATLIDNSEVVVKILRPNISNIIKKDVAILYGISQLIERFWSPGKRLRLVDTVAEFEQAIFDELDLMREAGSASQLRRNFLDSPMMYVPKIHWNFVSKNILVQERITGVRISDVSTLQRYGTNMKKLAEYGVEIFFTQVFRDNFFHADMHPGNLFVDIQDPQNPKYIGVDFGIMGSLSNFDQRYLAENLIAFFNRDYRRVALLHVESGWVPPDTRVEQMEAAIRTVCEPIFERPLNEISFGKLLLQLFVTAERFNMEIQPQLLLLQKTLVSIEGLGRQLYPELNLWETAKPFMKKWISEKYGLINTLKSFKEDWPEISDKGPHIPKMVLTILQQLQQRCLYQSVEKKKRMSKLKYQYRRGWLTGVGISFIAIPLLIKFMIFRGWLSPNLLFILIVAGLFSLCAAWWRAPDRI